VIQAGKSSFKRPRPFLLEPRIEPVVDKPPNDAYPSGHSMWARTVGLLLADMLPEHREKIMARSDEYAFNRVVAGVHYPSDVESGKLAATALAAFLFAVPPRPFILNSRGGDSLERQATRRGPDRCRDWLCPWPCRGGVRRPRWSPPGRPSER